MNKAKKTSRTLDSSELEEFIAKGSFYVPGHPYMWVMGFGWCIIGFYVCHDNPLTIRVAHANHFHQAHADYGVIAQEGPPMDKCEWRYEGNSLLHFHAIQRVDEYGGEVPRGRIIRS